METRGGSENRGDSKRTGWGVGVVEMGVEERKNCFMSQLAGEFWNWSL